MMLMSYKSKLKRVFYYLAPFSFISFFNISAHGKYQKSHKPLKTGYRKIDFISDASIPKLTLPKNEKSFYIQKLYKNLEKSYAQYGWQDLPSKLK